MLFWCRPHQPKKGALKTAAQKVSKSQSYLLFLTLLLLSFRRRRQPWSFAWPRSLVRQSLFALLIAHVGADFTRSVFTDYFTMVRKELLSTASLEKAERVCMFCLLRFIPLTVDPELSFLCSNRILFSMLCSRQQGSRS